MFALTLPEPAGTGLGMADAVVVFEELGRALVPGPLVGTFLAATGRPGRGCGRGRAQVGVHCAATRAARSGRAPGLARRAARLRGRMAAGRRTLLAPAAADGRDRVDAPLDPLTPLWRLDALPAGEPVPGTTTASLWRDGALLTAALQVGHAAEALDLAVAYAKERQQFGTPIGSFQADQAPVRRHAGARRGGPAAVHAAACLADAPDVVASEAAVAGCTPGQLVDRSVGGAKLLADEAALGNARTAIQVHGGMGFTWEVPLHLHLKRARVLSTTFGTPAEHAAALAAYAGATRP